MPDEELAARLLADLDVDVPDGPLAVRLAWLDDVRRDLESWGLEEFQLVPLLAGLAALRRLMQAQA
ncbi:MAG: hypothetical protein JWM71_1812 [Solirubrobacteraceae bacterium]|nr:hypothetical protein [Solirubrobacteraceae bacterium]